MSSLIYFGHFAKYVCCLSYHVGVFGIPKIGGAAVRDPVLLQGLFDGKTCLFHTWVNMPNLVFVAETVWAYVGDYQKFGSAWVLPKFRTLRSAPWGYGA